MFIFMTYSLSLSPSFSNYLSIHPPYLQTTCFSRAQILLGTIARIYIWHRHFYPLNLYILYLYIHITYIFHTSLNVVISYITSPVYQSRANGIITVKAEELAVCNDWLQVQFACKKLVNKDGLFGKSDPFIVIKKG